MYVRYGLCSVVVCAYPLLPRASTLSLCAHLLLLVQHHLLLHHHCLLAACLVQLELLHVLHKEGWVVEAVCLAYRLLPRGFCLLHGHENGLLLLLLQKNVLLLELW